jgi:hypothetical protein
VSKATAAAIERFRDELGCLDEGAFLNEVELVPALSDSDDPCWADDDAKAWTDVYRLIAMADVVGDRGWKRAVGPIYERAALGDLFETMRSIRHGPERAFSDDLEGFAAVLEPLTRHERPGTRQWSTCELGILRQLSSLPFLLDAVHDPVSEVCQEAVFSLQMLAQVHDAASSSLRDLLLTTAKEIRDWVPE